MACWAIPAIYLSLQVVAVVIALDYKVKVKVNKVNLAPGENFEYQCQAYKNWDDITQVIKTHMVIWGPEGNTTIQPPWGYYEVCNGTLLNPLVSEVTHRYRVIKNHKKSLVITIQNVRQEDSGFWSCRVLSEHQGVVVESPELEVLVVGPVIRTSITSGKRYYRNLEPKPNGATLVMTHDGYDDIGCDVMYSNVYPDISIYLKHNKNFINLKSQFSEMQLLDDNSGESGLVHINGTSIFRLNDNSDFIKNLFKYHGWTLVCKAKVKHHEPVISGAFLDILFPPVDIYCDEHKLSFPLGAKEAEMVCHVTGNSIPDVTWILPNKKEITRSVKHSFNVYNKLMGNRVTSVLTIKVVQAGYFGLYTFKAVNSQGSNHTTLNLTKKEPLYKYTAGVSSMGEHHIWTVILLLTLTSLCCFATTTH